MEWWQGFWGWAATTGLALVAAVVGVIELVQRARSRPRAHVMCRQFGTLTEGDAEPDLLVSLVNTGTAALTVLSMWGCGGAEFKFIGGQYRLPDVLLPGTPHDVLLKGSDPTKSAWILMQGVNAHSSRQHVFLWWVPVHNHGPAFDAWTKAVAASKGPRRWLPWWVKNRRARRLGVGVDGVYSARLPADVSLDDLEGYLQALVP